MSRTFQRLLPLALILSAAWLGAGCASRGSIIVDGARYPIDAPVVTFADPGGYDAYIETCFFDRSRKLPSRPAEGCDVPRRYGVRNPVDAGALKDRVHQLVLHFDVCVTSSRCFEVLHDVRGLSVHFMLDVDGTLYQTLDVKERARHAGIANDASIGIEIAHIGCYPPDDPAWRKYYAGEGDDLVLAIPESLRPPPGGPYRPARPGVHRAEIHGVLMEMPDYTEAQYETLIALVDTLTAIFPRLKADAPRGADGRLLSTVLERDELLGFEGVLGHFHVTRNKTDPGPALDWNRVLRRADL